MTRAGTDPLDEISYELRDSVITNPDGSVVFEMRGAEIPESWSQLATDIAVSKYFRKAGINGDPKRGERSVKELVTRVARTIREAGEKLGGYFATHLAEKHGWPAVLLNPAEREAVRIFETIHRPARPRTPIGA